MTQDIKGFDSLGLSAALLTALSDMKFEVPSPIQARTIPAMLENRDIMGLAQTGTGKTAAFALPILERLDESLRSPQALIIAPTRELAIQVGEQFAALSAHQNNILVSVLCGGQDYVRQLKQLKQGAHIVVGTPGRILDHIERGTLNLRSLKTFILDEADEMLRMGFIDDVEMILSKLPDNKQMALFSATMPHRIRDIANNYLKEPVFIEIQSETRTVKTVEQRFLFSDQSEKPIALTRVLAAEDYQGVIVFVRTKTSAEEVAEMLQKEKFRAMAIHGDITQALRERIISQFRQGVIDVLVATDVAARGLDVERVTHVINYDVPFDCETYVHRIGRTGRAGRSGITILFVTPRESRILNTIERHTRQQIEKVTVPDDHTIQLVRERRLMTEISERLEHEHLVSYQKLVDQLISAHPETELRDMLAAFMLKTNGDKPWRIDLPKMRKPSERKESRGDKKPFRDSFERKREGRGESRPHRAGRVETREFRENAPSELYRIDVGRIHGVKPGNIVGAIANEAGIQSRHITAIKIHDDHSTLKLPKGMPKEVFRDLNKTWICGRPLKLTQVYAG